MSKKQAISLKNITDWSKSFRQEPKNLLARNAITKIDYKEAAISRDAFYESNHVYSHIINLEGNITNQQATGRCWLFSALNTVRIPLMEQYNLDTFEFSQSYLFFWDKLEKANYFLDGVITHIDKDIDSQMNIWLFDNLNQDGGQWHMFINLVEKYGLVPKSVMRETFSSSNSRSMNYFLSTKLREFGLELRSMANKKSSDSKILKRKLEMMSDIYKFLSIFFGEPPKKFDWEFIDKKKKHHRMESLTPKSFVKKHVKFDFNAYYCLINDPSKKYYQTYILEDLGNIKEGQPIIYINLPIKELKSYTVKSLKRKEAVWFGSDFRHDIHYKNGVLDTNYFDHQLLFGSELKMNKKDRLISRASAMHHAMLFTGVDIKAGKPTAFRVQNSHGSKVGDKGFLMMTDKWFEEYVYEVAIHEQFLPLKVKKLLEKEPIVLAPWDPMGSLAN